MECRILCPSAFLRKGKGQKAQACTIAIGLKFGVTTQVILSKQTITKHADLTEGMSKLI